MALVALLMAVLMVMPMTVALAEGADEEPVFDIAGELSGGARQARAEFCRSVGFSERDMMAIFTTKFRIHRIQTELKTSLAAMAVAVLDAGDGDSEKLAAAERYVAERERLLAEQAGLEEALVRRVGADGDALKMAALMVLGAVDSGRRVTCAVNSEVSGGSGGSVKRRGRELGLRQPFSTQ